MSKVRNELTLWHDYDILPGDRTLYMGSHYGDDSGESGVDYALAEKMIKNLHILDKRATDQPVTIKMNSCGGDVYHGLAIYDAIKSCQNDVRIITYGYVMSMGSVILQAADERIMSPNSRMMIHYGQAGMGGHLLDIYKHTEELKELDSIVNNIYLSRIKEKKPRFAMKQLEDKMKFDWYLGSQEAILMGLCDRVLE
jgi:ATP-dependent Clp protease protease subunit